MNRTWKNAAAVIFTLLSFGHTLYAQQAPWSRLHNFCGDTSIYASDHIAQYADDSVIMVAGHTQTPGISTFHCYIGSFDYRGNLLHRKSLLSPGPVNFIVGTFVLGCASYPLVKISDDKYLLVAIDEDMQANTKINPVYQPFFYIFNSHCDSLGYKKYTDSIIDRRPQSVLVDNQKNIVVVGRITSSTVHFDVSTQAYHYDSFYIWLAKYDSNAHELWSKKFLGGVNTGEGYKVILSHDRQSYYITGGANGTVLIKTDSSGNIIWQKFLQQPNYRFTDLVATKDGNYAFVSTRDSAIPLYGEFFYGKFDEQGDIIWSRNWRDTNYYKGQMITEADNGDLLLFAKSYYYGDVNVLLRTTPDGEIKAYREYRHKDTITPSVTQSLFAMSYTPKKQILLSGRFSSPLMPGYFDSAGIFSWMALTDTFGCLEPGCQSLDTMWHVGVKDLHKSNSKIHIFPNPVNNELIIEGASTGTSFQLFDMLGRAVYRGLINRAKQNINTSALVAGTYILQLTSLNGERAMYKVVKE